MYAWAEMATAVGRKSVENGQTRILQRICDGVTSDFFLDIVDYKESDHHKLLHLVWRKFPRNQHSTEGQRTTATLSTQTEEASSAGLGLAPSADLTSISRNFLAPDADCPRRAWRLGRGLPRIVPSPRRAWRLRKGHPSSDRQKEGQVNLEL